MTNENSDRRVNTRNRWLDTNTDQQVFTQVHPELMTSYVCPWLLVLVCYINRCSRVLIKIFSDYFTKTCQGLLTG